MPVIIIDDPLTADPIATDHARKKLMGWWHARPCPLVVQRPGLVRLLALLRHPDIHVDAKAVLCRALELMPAEPRRWRRRRFG